MQYAIKNRKARTHVTTKEIREWKKCRTEGLTNSQIAKLYNRAHSVIVRYIGKQPKEFTGRAISNGLAKMHNDKKAVRENAITMKSVEVISKKSIEMKLLEKFVSVLSAEERLALSKMMKEAS